MALGFGGPSPADQFLSQLNQNAATAVSDGPANWSIGLPQDQQSQSPPPGLESTVAAISPPPALASVSPSVWDTIKQDAQSAMSWSENEVKNVYQGTKNVIGTVYTDAASGVGTVVSDVSKPFTSVYWYLILAVVVVAGGIYFIGKGGAIKASI